MSLHAESLHTASSHIGRPRSATAIAVATLFALLPAQGWAQAPGGPATLPAGQAKELVEGVCTACHRTNEIVKVLTLASVIFLPGALLAGIMGMNFKPGLFTHPSLFWFTIAVILSIAITTLGVARVRHWI